MSDDLVMCSIEKRKKTSPRLDLYGNNQYYNDIHEQKQALCRLNYV
jgi:hypothetical protein